MLRSSIAIVLVNGFGNASKTLWLVLTVFIAVDEAYVCLRNRETRALGE